MNYIEPQQIITRLPRAVRDMVSEQELISHIIVSYRELKLPQDVQYAQEIISSDTGSELIPDYYKQIKSVELIISCPDLKDCYDTKTVYFTGTHSDLCDDRVKCPGNCQLFYSIKDRTLILPSKNSDYLITYSTLYSDTLKIYEDETLIKYLVANTNYRVLEEKAFSGDINPQLMNQYLQMSEALYSKVRGELIMQTIRKHNHRLDTRPINFRTDELSTRYQSH